MTPTEKYLSELCKDTFLPFWSFPNPIGKRLDKELCDLLIICDPDIIIFSVKEINIKNSGDNKLDNERWERKAIEESVSQIYGAERIISMKEEVLLKDKKTKIKLPENGVRNIYRIAVAFGRGERFSLKFGDFGKGFVHVFDEQSIRIVLSELNTISDFVGFLQSMETFISKGIRHIAFSHEDYLAMHLLQGLDVSDDTNILIIDSNYWAEYYKSKEYSEYKNEYKISYIWDGLINTLCQDFNEGNLINSVSRQELELAIRLMNKETRLSRKELSKLIIGVIVDESIKKKARIVCSDLPDQPIYVIMVRPHNDREFGQVELKLRCLVARSLFQDRKIVIGIATDPYENGKGHSIDLVYLDLTEWGETQQKEAEQISNELGYFKSAVKYNLKMGT